MIYSATKTIYFNLLQLSILTNNEYEFLENTTLNEKFNILKNIKPKEYPKLKYISIGNSGFTKVSADNSSVSKFSKHSALDGALFKHIPFIIRKEDQDLTPGEKEKYRFRVLKNINGVKYWCYYLRLIDELSISRLMTVSNLDGKNFLSLFSTNDSKILNPTPIYKDLDNPNFIVASLKMNLTISEEEIDEIHNAIDIIYGSDDIHTITEFGLLTGVDYTTNDPNMPTEAVGVQTAFILETDNNIQNSIENKIPLAKEVEIGGMEVLM